MPNDKKGKGGTYIPETAYLGTDGGPASAPAKADRPAVKQAKLVGEVAGSMPHNGTKASEYGRAGAEEGGYRPIASYPGVHVVAKGGEGTADLIASMIKHRHFERETDPPMV